jgi:hypothetical protein
VPLPVGVPLGLWLAVLLLLSEMLPLVLALAPELKEAVGLADRVLLELCVLDGVLLLLPVAVCVLLPVAVQLELWLGVTLLLSEALPELEALAPAVKEAVGLPDKVELPLVVLLGVLAAVPDPV